MLGVYQRSWTWHGRAHCVCMFPHLYPHALQLGCGVVEVTAPPGEQPRREGMVSRQARGMARRQPTDLFWLCPPPTVTWRRTCPHPQFLANCRVLDTPTPRGGGSDGAARSMVMMRRHDEPASARNGQTVAHQPLWAVVSFFLSSSAHTVLSPVSGSAACTVSACRREARWATEHM